MVHNSIVIDGVARDSRVLSQGYDCQNLPHSMISPFFAFPSAIAFCNFRTAIGTFSAAVPWTDCLLSSVINSNFGSYLSQIKVIPSERVIRCFSFVNPCSLSYLAPSFSARMISDGRGVAYKDV
jgi:hypothetical protein